MKPKESRIESYAWLVPEEIAPGEIILHAGLSYRRLPRSGADLVCIGEIPVLPVSADRVSWTAEKYLEEKAPLGENRRDVRRAF